MGKAPDTCLYCDDLGNSKAGGSCGFCEGGKPLDTQEDWDRSWGRVFADETPDPSCTVCNGGGTYVNSRGRDSGDPCNLCRPIAFDAFLRREGIRK